MQRTIFDTPVIKTIFRMLSLLLLRILGWQKAGALPDAKKYVLIAAPHTSNWDFLYTILIAFAFKQKIFWMGKDKIFKKPFAPIVRWAGGIAVDRNRATNLVDETIRHFNEHERLVVVIPPEGTRQKVSYWKTGFYWIAYGAKVPILLGFLDYTRKIGGFGPLVQPTGDIDADMAVIRSFYANISGKKPSHYNEHAGVAEYKKEKIVS